MPGDFQCSNPFRAAGAFVLWHPEYARRHEWKIAGMRVDVDCDAERTPRHQAVHLHLPDRLTGDQVARLRRVAETCPVRRAFEAGSELEEQISLDAGSRLAA